MKKTKLLTSLAALALVLGLGACDVSEEETPSEGDSTSSEPSGSETLESAPYEDGSYFLGFEVDGKDNYIDGGIVSNRSYEGSYTDDITKAVPVTLKAVEGNSYTLTFTLEEVTYYITTVVTTNDSGTFTNLSYSTSEGLLYWNSTYSCWGNESGDYFLCCNTTWSCLYLSDVEAYIESSPIAKLYEIPEDWEPYAPREDAGVSYEDVEGLSLLGYYDFSKSDYNASDAFGSVDSVTEEPNGLTEEQVVSLFSDCYVAGTVEKSLVASVESTHAYKAANGASGGLTTSDACLKLNSSSSTDGAITLGVEVEGYSLNSVVVTAAGYSNNTTFLNVNGSAQTLTQAASALTYIDEVNSYTYELSDASEVTLAAASRVLIFGIAIYGEEVAAEPDSETLTIDSTFGEDNGHNYEDYFYMDGVTYSSLDSCNLTFSGTTSEHQTQAFSSYLRLRAGSSITFTPKNGHKLVEISFTYYRSSGTALSANDSAASVTYDSDSATVYDIVDGSSALTITNSDTQAIDFSSLTISYY